MKKRVCKLNIMNLLCTVTLVQFGFFINYYAGELNMLQIKNLLNIEFNIQYSNFTFAVAFE